MGQDFLHTASTFTTTCMLIAYNEYLLIKIHIYVECTSWYFLFLLGLFLSSNGESCFHLSHNIIDLCTN